MTAVYIIGIVIGIILFFVLGYYLWSTALDKYDYNIFNLGVIIRGLIAMGCLWFGIVMIDAADGSTTVWLIVSGVLWVWTFVATASRTSIPIAVFSLIYQLFAVVLIKSAINKIMK
ncbi:hypothetical protein [Gelidibacter maritimus]|uniref:Uncharacterized protein n=1 Tax=Gelidibacter maritimus TaxID=2761487 RepID=A0A7W2R2V2_9FLAO|nr:hypothetical protein [Gelidibacter maritimus]MBA6152189.1 hypothetical protein [Gelidibacter maritimus]